MVWWWIAVVAYLVLVVPIVVVLLHRTVRRAAAARRAAGELGDHGRALSEHVERLEELRRTQSLVEDVKAGAARYGRALEELR